MVYKKIELASFLEELDRKFLDNPDLWYEYILPRKKRMNLKQNIKIIIQKYGMSIAQNAGLQ